MYVGEYTANKDYIAEHKKLLAKELKKIHVKNTLIDEELIQAFDIVSLAILRQCQILSLPKVKRKKNLVIFEDKITNFKLSFIKINDIWFYNYGWKEELVIVLRYNSNIVQLCYDYILKLNKALFKTIRESVYTKALTIVSNLFEKQLNQNELRDLLQRIQQSEIPKHYFLNKDLANEAADLAKNLIGKRKALSLNEKEWIYQKANEVVTILQSYDSKDAFLEENPCLCTRKNCIHTIIEEMSPIYTKVSWHFNNSQYNFREEYEPAVLKEQAGQLKTPIQLNVQIDFGNSIVNHSPLTEKQINSLTLGSLYLDGFKDAFGYCPRFVILALLAKNQLKEDTVDDYTFVKDTYFNKDKTFVTCSNTKHWFGFLISKSDRMIYYFDSTLAFGEDRGRFLQVILLALNGGLDGHETVSVLFKKKFSDWKIKNCPVPKQPDRYQCGDNLFLNILEIARNYEDVLDTWSKVPSVSVILVAKEEPNLYELRDFKFATPLKDDQLVLNYRDPNRVRSEFVFKEYKRLEKQKSDVNRRKYKVKSVVNKIVGKNMHKLSKTRYKNLVAMTKIVLKDLNEQNMSISESQNLVFDKAETSTAWPSYRNVISCFTSELGKDSVFKYSPIKDSFLLLELDDSIVEKEVLQKIRFDDIVGFKKAEIYWMLERFLQISKFTEQISLILKKETVFTNCDHMFVVRVEYFNKIPVGLVFSTSNKVVHIIDPMNAITSLESYAYFKDITDAASMKIFNVTNIVTTDKKKATEIILKTLVLFVMNPTKILESWVEDEYCTIESLYTSKPSISSYSLNRKKNKAIFAEVLEENYKLKWLYREVLQ